MAWHGGTEKKSEQWRPEQEGQWRLRNGGKAFGESSINVVCLAPPRQGPWAKKNGRNFLSSLLLDAQVRQASEDGSRRFQRRNGALVIWKSEKTDRRRAARFASNHSFSAVSALRHNSRNG